MSKLHTVKDLKNAYDKAVKDDKKYFKIGEYDFDRGYAKYLIQYLDMAKISNETHLKSILVKKSSTPYPPVQKVLI